MIELLVPKFARLDEYAGIWLVEPAAAGRILEVARRSDLAAHVARGQAEPPKLTPLTQLVEAKNGQTVAVIPVAGMLMKQRSSMGGTSTVQLRRDVRQAANDPNVGAILLNIDSPGGTTAGLEDLAADVKAAGKKKPVWAQVEDLAASAAYWVASQTSQIYAGTQTALVGSIGTYLTVYDVSEGLARDGVKTLHFATGPLKGAGVMGTAVSDEQRKYFQGIVDGVQAEFDRAVQSGRGFTKAQLEAVRTGGVWKAAQAQELGLIEGVQPVDRTVEMLSKAAVGDPQGRRRAGAFPTPTRSGLPTLRGESK